jgi:nitrate/nitrite transport system substrate-binding protein
MAVWILTQLKRWNYIKGDINYQAVAEEVFRATDARARMAELGMKPPKANYMKHTIMGKVFDPAKPAEYLNSFAIKRT